MKLKEAYQRVVRAVKSVFYEEVPFYSTKEGKKWLDDLVEESGAPSRGRLLGEAADLYSKILKNRKPGETVNIFVGDSKLYPADKHFDFEKPRIDKEIAAEIEEIIENTD